MDDATRAWPLSAAATAVLRDPTQSPGQVLKLALKELVLRRAWTIERRPRGRVLGRARSPEIVLRPGDARVPPLAPLPTLDAALRAVVDDEGRELADAVRRLGKRTTVSGDTLRDEIQEALAREGLLAHERRKVLGVVARTAVSVTASGESWRQGSYDREEQFVEQVTARSASVPAQAAALGGLTLLLSPAPLAGLDAQLRRLRGEHGAGSGGAAHGDGSDADGDLDLAGLGELDLGSLDVLDSFDAGFDSAVDAGAGGGDGGGSGGDGGAS